MIVGFKDSFKLVGVIIVSFCAVCVCALFINYNIDLKNIEGMISGEQMIVAYDAMLSTGKIVCAITGGCLTLTGFFLIIFYVNQYITRSRRELGILKAMGYSDIRISCGFSVFGLSVFIGTALGIVVSYCIMPDFYSTQNEPGLLPKVELNFHYSVVALMTVVTSALFGIFSVTAGYMALKRSAYDLLNDKPNKVKIVKEPKRDISFLSEMRLSVIKSRPSLAFFIAFGGFCYGAMVQMSIGMKNYSGKMMTIMMLVIGLILAFMSLFLSMTSVIKSNSQTAALMYAMGYSQNICRRVIIGGYRPFAWVGFAIGTLYQYGLLKIMVNVVFKNYENIAPYTFDFKALILAFVSFTVVYEAVSFYYAERIRRASAKSIFE